MAATIFDVKNFATIFYKLPTFIWVFVNDFETFLERFVKRKDLVT